MENIEEFKLAHKDQLLHHSFEELVKLSGLFNYETEYAIMQMKNYLYDIKHVLEQKMDYSVISHLTYNLNIQLLHSYNQANEYYEASRYYLIGNLGLDIPKRIEEYQAYSQEIKVLIKNINDISLFDIYCAHPGDFLTAYHYKKGLEGTNGVLINLERDLSFMNGVQLLNCLLYLMDLTEKKMLDIRNGITYESREFIELVYDLNYVFYADNYWIEKRDTYRSHVENDELVDGVTIKSLHDYYKQLLKDFKTNPVGRLWDENEGNKCDLAYELKKLPLTIEQWEYYFKTILKLDEIKRWINELRNLKQRDNNANGVEVPQGELDQKIVIIFTDKLLSADEPSHLYFLMLAMWARRLLQSKEIPAFVRMVGEAYPDFFNEERTIEKVIMSLQNMNGKAGQYFDEYVKDQATMVNYIDMMYPKKVNGNRRKDCERAVALANKLFLALK